MPIVLNEDAALKQKLSGLTVTDENAPDYGRIVVARFRTPEYEIGDMTYPAIIIEHGPMTRAKDREMRGPVVLPYVPEGFPTANIVVPDPETQSTVLWDPNDPNVDSDVTLSPFYVPDCPVPFNVDYIVTVHCRLQAHLTQLVGILAGIDYLPPRFGYLEVEQDDTVRTLELLGGPEFTQTHDSDGKRIFRAVYSIRVASELALSAITQQQGYVTEVAWDVIELAVSPDGSQTTEHFIDEP